ncbi:GTA-gp10 family protein [Gemmobacter nectariphilus]|uniref:GTA-gp10 family protein n=1 Tax=Gemmobacter nectariphilus TaxID=220343 RepID=UPI0004038DCA|nr:GTA-gp10 family protein [Gemmobacter nectariphilus]
MAISGTGAYEEIVGGQRRRLLLTNHEIQRFELQYAPFGIFELYDQLFGRASPPQVRHVRDLIALGLVGGGMSDRAADDLISSLPPSDNVALRGIAQRLMGVTFFPDVLAAPPKKGGAGSRVASRAVQPRPTTEPEIALPTSAA